MADAAAGERFEEAAQMRDAMRTVQTLHDRQQKMATAELGHRDVFGLKLGPAGVVIQVFQVRSGRVVERVELGTEEAIVGSREGEVLEAAIQQFYELRGAPPEIHVPAEPDEREALESWLSERAGGASAFWCRSAARSAGSSISRTATPRSRIRRASIRRPPRSTTRSRRCRRCSRCRRCRGASSASTSRRFRAARPWRRWWCARTAACAGASIGSFGSEGLGLVAVNGTGTEAAALEPRLETEARCRQAFARGGAPPPVNNDFAAMHEVVLRRYRKLLEQGGPFPDLILIDGGKGQLSAAYAALEELGLANLVAVGIAKKEELLYTRDRVDPIALAAHDPALLLVQRIRDEAHRFAVTFHRRARTMRDLRSELDHVPGIGPRRRRTLLTTFGSVAGVRRATREELAAVVGPKAADAVLAFFASRP